MHQNYMACKLSPTGKNRQKETENSQKCSSKCMKSCLMSQAFNLSWIVVINSCFFVLRTNKSLVVLREALGKNAERARLHICSREQQNTCWVWTLFVRSLLLFLTAFTSTVSWGLSPACFTVSLRTQCPSAVGKWQNSRHKTGYCTECQLIIPRQLQTH